jgi:hypothetical protein
MVIDCNYKDKNKGFYVPKSELLIELFTELHNFVIQSSSLTKIERFQAECKLTEIIKKLVDICNNSVFLSFNLELKMVE